MENIVNLLLKQDVQGAEKRDYVISPGLVYPQSIKILRGVDHPATVK